jgi:uncharacterized delta-60 repeat protein
MRSTAKSISLAIVVSLCAAPVAFPQAGTLDPTFADNGIFAFPTTMLTAAKAVALQADGKIVIAGGGPVNSNQSVSNVLVRLNTNGTLDTSFGTAGAFTFNPSTGNPGGFFALAIQPNGNIVAASTSFLQLVRLTPSGTLDTSFGSGGITEQVSSAVASAGALALESSGKIVVAFTCVGCGQQSQVARYDSNGKLDSSFGTAGFINLQTPATSSIGLRALSDGKILVSAAANQTIPPLAANGAPTSLLSRYNPNGASMKPSAHKDSSPSLPPKASCCKATVRSSWLGG